MKNLILVLSSAVLTQFAIAAGGDGPGNSSLKLAQTCLDQDTQVVQKAQPMELERSFKDLNFMSEIFYQIVLNRIALVERYKEFTDEYIALEEELARLKEEQEQVSKDLSLSPYGNRTTRDLNEEEFERFRNESNKNNKPILEIYNKQIAFKDGLIKNPSLGEYVKQIESRLRSAAEMNNNKKEDLRYFTARKSYGDHLIKMTKSNQTCDQIHEKYKKLAIEAKAKKNFRLETISALHMIDLEKRSVTEVTKTIRSILDQADYRKAAETYTYSKNSTLAYVISTGAFYVVVDQAFGGKSSYSDFDLGPKTQTAQQLEQKFNAQIKKEMVSRHNDMSSVISGIMK